MTERTAKRGVHGAPCCVARDEAREDVDGEMLTRLAITGVTDAHDGDEARERTKLRRDTVRCTREQGAIECEHRRAVELQLVRCRQRGNSARLDVVSPTAERRVDERIVERAEEERLHVKRVLRAGCCEEPAG